MTQPNKFVFLITILLLLLVSLIPTSVSEAKVLSLPLHNIVFGLSSLLLLAMTLPFTRITAFDKWLGLLVFFLFSSLITSVDNANTVKSTVGFLCKGIVVAWIAERVISQSNKLLITRVLLICGLLVALIGLIEFVFHWNPYFKLMPALTNYSLTARSGMSSTIGHPIAFASYLLLLLPLSLWFVQREMSFLRFFPFAFFALGILLSFSRSSWIGTTLALFFYFFYSKELRDTIRNNWKPALFILTVLVSSFLLMPGAKDVLSQRADLKIVKGELTASHRSASYATVRAIVKEYPLFGVGLGNYPKVHEKYRAPGAALEYATPDNMYLRLLSEIGIFGTSAFLAFLMYWLFRLFRNRADGFTLAVLSGLIGFLVNLMAADLFYWPAPQFLFWLLLGMGVASLEHT